MPLDPQGAQPKIPEISVRNQMEQTISIRSDRYIWDYRSRLSTLTGQVTSVGQWSCRFSEISNRSVCQMESAPNLPKMDCEVFSLLANNEYDMILIYITERRIYL